MAATDTSGIRHKVYMAGRLLERDPAPIQLAPKRWEGKVRLSNNASHIDRGYIEPFFPNILDKVDIMLPYSHVAETALLEHLSTVLAIGQPFDVCTFKQHKDVFDGDGSQKVFYLQRLPAMPMMEAFEPGIGAAYAIDGFSTRVELFSAAYGSSASAVTPSTTLTVTYKTETEIAGGTPGAGVAWVSSDGFSVEGSLMRGATIKLGTAPANAHDSLIVTYIPLYRMAVESDSGRTFNQALQEARNIKLSEL
jgi:hypothetical protein